VEECTYFWGVNTSWGINTAESKRPLNQEDNQAPQPTCKRITMLIFINKIMSRVYSLIFCSDLPRVPEEMKSSLQPNPESMVGYWVLFTQSTVIWVYGYQEGPYILLVFLTPRIFALEFIRQRIISETEHFLKAHKASNLKFPFMVGPFVVKNKSYLPQIQSKLSEFGFT
jgi:hypothetical protein